MDLDHLTPAELTDVITQSLAAENAFRRMRLRAMAAYDRKEGWKADGATSMASWTVGMLGAGRDTANEEVRVARALEDLPQIAETFSEGLLSWDQTRAVTQFATTATDEQLADEARRFSAPQLRRMARRFEPVTQQEAQQAIAERSLRMWWDAKNKMLKFGGQLPGDDGARFETAIERHAKQVARFLDSGEPFSWDKLRADALVELASLKLGADPDPDRATVGVHVDASVLAGGKGMAELDGGKSIALETARKLTCDSRWYIVVDGPDGLPVGIGRVSRQIAPWLAREIRHRDAGCRWTGCNRTGWVAIHHIVHWGEGGPTDMQNLITLCGPHHRLVHEGGWKILGNPNGDVTFVAPDGRRISQGPPPLRAELRDRVTALTSDAHIEVGPDP